MPDADGQRIQEHVAAGRFEAALDIGPTASRSALNARHVRRLREFQHHPDVREALNRAKNALAAESSERQGLRLLRLGDEAAALAVLMSCTELSADGLHLLGRLLARQGDHRSSLAVAERAVALRGAGLDHELVAAALSALGSHEDALWHLERAALLQGRVTDEALLGELGAKVRRDRLQRHLTVLATRVDAWAEEPLYVLAVLALACWVVIWPWPLLAGLTMVLGLLPPLASGLTARRGAGSAQEPNSSKKPATPKKPHGLRK